MDRMTKDIKVGMCSIAGKSRRGFSHRTYTRIKEEILGPITPGNGESY